MSGFSLSVGYGIGIGLVLFWHYLELPQSGSKFQRIAKRVTTIAVVSNVAYFMWHATVWQNSIRLLMEMDPLESAYCWPVAIIAVLVGIMWLAFFRAIRKGYFYIDNKLSKILPHRVSLVLSLVVICSLLFFIINGILAKQDLILADSIFLRLDRITDEGFNSLPMPWHQAVMSRLSHGTRLAVRARSLLFLDQPRSNLKNLQTQILSGLCVSM